MKLKLFLFSVLLTFIAPIFLVAENNLPRVAIMDLGAKAPITQSEAEAVSDFLRTDLVNTKKFIVVERTRIKDILKEQEMSLSGLTETEKAAKIGKILNCRYIIVGTLSQLGSKYFLNVRVVDVETGANTLAKRESTSSIEDMSEVSRSIASQLAGIKYVRKSEKESQPEKEIKQEEKFNNPPIGFEVQYGTGISYQYKEVTTLQTGNEIDVTATPDYYNLSFGGYFWGIYIGKLKKEVNLYTGDTVDITETGTFETNYTSELYSDFTFEYSDFIIGFMSRTKGKLNPKLFYFSKKYVSMQLSANESPDEYSGYGFGFVSRNSIGIGNFPLELLVLAGFDFGYLDYDSGDVSTSDIYAISLSGDIGIGMQLKRIGLYFILAYSGNGFMVFNDSPLAQIESVIYKSSGLELKIGYNFDMQALFH